MTRASTPFARWSIRWVAPKLRAGARVLGLSLLLVWALGCGEDVASPPGMGTGGVTGSGGAVSTGGTVGASGAAVFPTGSGFVHPGTLDGTAELDFVKTQLAAGAEPWTSHFGRVKSVESLAAAPTVRTTIDANTGAAELARNEARRAYGHALGWYLTGEELYAKQALAQLSAWASLQSITATDEQNRLLGGWLGSLLGPAADLMLGYAAWDPLELEKTRAMFKLAFI
jgi:hypothetical protein